MHAAISANLRSIEYAMAKDREAWLALYRNDAVVSDPVGVSPFDPVGDGHVGKEALASFFDNVIAGANVTIVPGEHRVSGEFSCAVPMQAINDLGEGVTATVDMIAVYHVDTQGLIKSMSAYWDWSKLEQQMAEIFSSL